MNSLFALLAGILLGIAQLSMRHIFFESSKSLFLIPIIFILFFSSGIIWIRLLKISDNLAMLYGILIFGSFLSIIMGSQILISKKIIIHIKEVIAIFLISTGCYLLK